MWMCYYLCIFYLCGVWSFDSNRKHFLSTLLSLDFVVWRCIFVALMMVKNFLFIFWFFSVCESYLVLSILVSMNRSHVNDYFQNFYFYSLFLSLFEGFLFLDY